MSQEFPNFLEEKIQKFLATWKHADSEESTAQSFFRELCQLLGVDEPPKGKPDEGYRFEKRVPVPEGTSLRKKKADVYRRGAFVWENKCFRRSPTGARPSRWVEWMREGYEQARRYARHLADDSEDGKRPPILAVCDVGREIWLWNTFTMPDYGAFEDRREILLEDLLRPKIFRELQWALSDPQRLNPLRESGRVTLEIAKSLGSLANRLRERLSGADDMGEPIARFMMACIFTLFAEDVELLKGRVFRESLKQRWQKQPELFGPEVKRLWALMRKGGEDRQFGKVSRFTGGLFHDCPVLPLDAAELKELAVAASFDWTEVEPSIFGTLLEQSLRAHERSRLGAHFTPRSYIERIVRPAVIEPLRDAWQVSNAAAVQLSGRAKAERERGNDRKAREYVRDARGLCTAFLARLRAVQVLDPACGTGNFLYVAMDLIKQLEKEVLVALRDLGEAHQQLTAVLVQPDQFHGIEKKRWSKEIAELVLWIGYLQWWRREYGTTTPPEPVLRRYENIEEGDAILAWEREEAVLDRHGRAVVTTRQGKGGRGAATPVPQRRFHGVKATKWPNVDFIVSNPPFIGNKRMRELLGDGYVEAVRSVYEEQGVPGDVDLVAYWWHKAALQLQDAKSRLVRFAFITTNSIRQRQSGAVLRRHLGDGLMLHFACPDHPWVDPSEELGSAAVRISMTVVRAADELGARGPLYVEDVDSRRDPRAALGRLNSALQRGQGAEEDGALEVHLREVRGAPIHADLSVGPNLTLAEPLAANRDLCFQGMNLVGDGFRLTREQVGELLGRKKRPPELRRYMMGRDLKEAPVERYVIDFFGLDEAQAERASPTLFNHLVRDVKPLRASNSRANYVASWWTFGEARPGLRRAIAGLGRYIATVETSKHRFFVMLDADVVPDHQLYVIASDDYYVLGVLSSRAHVQWALRTGGSNGVGNDPRWNSTVTFAPFPFPRTSEPQKQKIRGIAERIERARRLVLAEHVAVSLTDVYNVVERLRGQRESGVAPLTPEESRRAVEWRCDTLMLLHDQLDAEVLAAYGFDEEVSSEALLQALLDLNHVRVAEESEGKILWLRPEFQEPLWAQRKSQKSGDIGGAPARTASTMPKWPTGQGPDVMRRQMAVIREVLIRSGKPSTLNEIAREISKPRGPGIEPILERHLGSLELVGAVTSGDDARGTVWSLNDDR